MSTIKGEAPTRDFKRESKMLKMAEKGVSFKEIGQVFGISRQRVHQVLTRAGYDRRTQEREAHYQQAVRRVIDAEGAISVNQAAKEAQVHPQTIHVRLIEKGYDSAKMRAAFLEQRRVRRLQGKGVGKCTICGEVKPWGEFTRKRVKGVLQRVRRCLDCEKRRRKAYS